LLICRFFFSGEKEKAAQKEKLRKTNKVEFLSFFCIPKVLFGPFSFKKKDRNINDSD
jgi:hypothetical protein